MAVLSAKRILIYCVFLSGFSLMAHVGFAQAPIIMKRGPDSGCVFTRYPVYIINKNNVIYQDCNSRKVLKPDMRSFKQPDLWFRNDVAFDKNGVYVRGVFVKIDTTGFENLGSNESRTHIYWKTGKKVFDNTTEIKDVDAASFTTMNCINGDYFKDKNYLYYRGKKIPGSDGASATAVDCKIVYDKNYVYENGEVEYYKGEPLHMVNKVLFKTATHVLYKQYYEGKDVPDADASTLRKLSDRFAIDKRHIYANYGVTLIDSARFKNIQVWDEGNAFFISDGEHIYRWGTILMDSLDAASFGVIPKSDFYYDKNGIYKRDKLVDSKVPFNYTIPVVPDNFFSLEYGRFLVYNNQVYEMTENRLGERRVYKLHKDVPDEQIQLLKNGKRVLLGTGNKSPLVEVGGDTYNGEFYKGDGRVYKRGKEVAVADASSFRFIDRNYVKDNRHVYFHGGGSFKILEGADPASFQEYNAFFQFGFYRNPDEFYLDKNWLYSEQNRLISAEGLTLLAKFDGYRYKDGAISGTYVYDYFLFKNVAGYWFVGVFYDGRANNEFIGKKLPQNWKALLNKTAKNK